MTQALASSPAPQHTHYTSMYTSMARATRVVYHVLSVAGRLGALNSLQTRLYPPSLPREIAHCARGDRSGGLPPPREPPTHNVHCQRPCSPAFDVLQPHKPVSPSGFPGSSRPTPLRGLVRQSEGLHRGPCVTEALTSAKPWWLPPGALAAPHNAPRATARILHLLPVPPAAACAGWLDIGHTAPLD